MSDDFLNDNYNHSYNVGIRKAVGCTDAAVVHFHIAHWVRYNFTTKNPIAFQNGRWWTFQTQEEIAAHFQYFNRRQVGRLIEKLVEADLLMVDNFNSFKPDRTIWYTLTDKAIQLLGWSYQQPMVKNDHSVDMRVPAIEKPANPLIVSLVKNGQALVKNGQAIEDNKTEDNKNCTVQYSTVSSSNKLKEILITKLNDPKITVWQADELLKYHNKEIDINWSIDNYAYHLTTEAGSTIIKKYHCLLSHIKKTGYFEDQKTYANDEQKNINPKKRLNDCLDISNIVNNIDYNDTECTQSDYKEISAESNTTAWVEPKKPPTKPVKPKPDFFKNIYSDVLGVC